MKKYIEPKFHVIELGYESALMTGSITKGEGTLENENQILTRRQDDTFVNSPWDDWSE